MRLERSHCGRVHLSDARGLWSAWSAAACWHQADSAVANGEIGRECL